MRQAALTIAMFALSAATAADAPQFAGSTPARLTGTVLSDAIAVADLDGDGRDEFIVVARSDVPFGSPQLGAIHVGTRNPDGSFTLSRTEASSGFYLRPRLARIDPDASPDLVVAHRVEGPEGTEPVETLEYFRGRGDRTFAASVVLDASAGFFHEPLLGDLDGDGDHDVLDLRFRVANQAYEAQAKVSDGAGGFVDGPIVPLPAGQGHRLLDGDGDGVLDLVFTRIDGFDSGPYLARGDGAGGFELSAQWTRVPMDSWSWWAVDFDQDADLDLITVRGGVGAFGAYQVLDVWRADAGTLVLAGSGPLVGDQLPMTVEDLDGDGTVEVLGLLWSSPNGTLGIAERAVTIGRIGADGSVSQLPGFRVGYQAAVGDLDGDGRGDLVGTTGDFGDVIVNLRRGTTAANSPPTTFAASYATAPGVPLVFAAAAVDPDSNVLFFERQASLPLLPHQFTLDSYSGAATFSSGAVGLHSIYYSVTDLSGAVAYGSITVDVRAADDDRPAPGGGGAPDLALLLGLAGLLVARRRRT